MGTIRPWSLDIFGLKYPRRGPYFWRSEVSSTWRLAFRRSFPGATKSAGRAGNNERSVCATWAEASKRFPVPGLSNAVRLTGAAHTKPPPGRDDGAPPGANGAELVRLPAASSGLDD